MKKSVIAIIDEDENFVVRLADYLSESKSLGYKISAFTDMEKLDAYSSICELAFVIAGEDFIREKGEITYAPVIRICEERDEEEKDGIYRYSPGDYYIKRFIELTGIKNVAVCLDPEGKSKIIGIYSPIKRMFKTTFALTLGQILAKNNRVLYLNFESYSGFYDLFGAESYQNMSDLIYVFNNMGEDFKNQARRMIQTVNSLDYIKPVTAYTDLYDIDYEVWEALLNNLSRWGEYDYIILDLSDSIKGLFDILGLCSLIYTVIADDEISIAKTNQYELMLKDEDREEIINKTRKYQMPVFRKIPAIKGELVRSEMGSFVKELIRGDLAL